MNLQIYSIDELLLTAMKAEFESKNLYSKLSNRVENFLLKERLNFLANEEGKHQIIFESLYTKIFPGKKIDLPSKSPVPLPKINTETETTPISKILESAMDAEKTAYDFYLGISERIDNKPDIKIKAGDFK